MAKYHLSHPHTPVDNATYLDWVLKANGGVFPAPLARVLIKQAVRRTMPWMGIVS